MLFKTRHHTCLILLAVLAGCSRPGARRELTVAHRGWPLTLTPHLKGEVVTVSVQSNIFEGLVALTPGMELRPQLAEKWECPDEQTWIFKIRQGIGFHDGTRLTAEDVVYSIERASKHPSSVFRGNFTMVKAVEAVDGNTIRISTNRPCPTLLNKLIDVSIVPRAAMERFGDEGFSRSPVGTGPYRLASFPQGGPIILERWKDYWGDKPTVERMIIKSWLDIDSVTAMLDSGQVDIVTQINEPQARALIPSSRAGFQVIRHPGLLMRYLGINCRNPVLEDKRVRRALALSVDREAIVDRAYGGYAIPANQLVTAGRFGFNPKLPRLDYDTLQARRLIAEAGYPHGLDLTLALPSTSDLGVLLQKQMGASGIRLSLKPMNREDFLQAVDTASLYLLGALGRSIDAADLLEEAIHSRSEGYGQSNRGRYSNPKVDRLIEEAASITEPSRRLRVLQEAMRLVMEDMPRVPLVVGDDLYCVSDRILWRPRADMMVLGREVGYQERGIIR